MPEGTPSSFQDEEFDMMQQFSVIDEIVRIVTMNSKATYISRSINTDTTSENNFQQVLLMKM